MRAKDVLLEAIAAFSGTVVFVSHDRYFIDRLATRVLEVGDGAVTSHEGNYADYLRWKEAQAAGAANRASSVDRSSGSAFYQGATSVVPQSRPSVDPALAPARSSQEPAQAPAASGNTIVIEGGPDDAVKKRRLNPIKQKQLEDRCSFLEEEIPRIEASIAHTEEQLGVYISAGETARLSGLATDLRNQLATLTAEWEDLTMQLDAQAALS
jgi:ATP-binding cassette subfamily F protein 3